MKPLKEVHGFEFIGIEEIGLIEGKDQEHSDESNQAGDEDRFLAHRRFSHGRRSSLLKGHHCASYTLLWPSAVSPF
jgi:hypothetical protein